MDIEVKIVNGFLYLNSQRDTDGRVRYSLKKLSNYYCEKIPENPDDKWIVEVCTENHGWSTEYDKAEAIEIIEAIDEAIEKYYIAKIKKNKNEGEKIII